MANSSHSVRRWRSLLPSGNVLAVVAALNLFILLLGGSALLDGYHTAQARARQSAQDLSIALAEGLGGLFDRIDFSILSISDVLRQRNLPESLLRERIADWRERMPMLENIWVADASGRIILDGKGSISAADGVGLDDRDYFQILKENPAAGMVISHPVVGRVSQQWIIPLARRIESRDGQFAGVVVVGLPVGHVSSLFAALHLGRDGAVSLRAADDLSVTARFPETIGRAVAVGKTSISTELKDLVRSNPQAGDYVAKAGIDGIERALSYRRIGDRPVLVVVGLATSETVSEWRRGAMPLMVGMAGFLLLSLAGGSIISRIWRQRGEALTHLQAMAAEQERFSEILAHHLQEPVRIQHIFAQRLKTLLPEPLSEDMAVTLNHLLRGATRQRALLRDVRTFLTLDELLSVPVKSCDAEAAMAQLLHRFDPQLNEIGAQLLVGELPIAPLPEKPFVIMMTALIENAIQYRSPDRPLMLRIEGGQAGGYSFFSVSDNGIGIPASFRHKAFDVFERLAPHPEHTGTGIGLAMVRKIVERSGGRAEIADGEDGGTRVTVFLPA